MSAAEIEQFQRIMRDAIPIIARDVEELEDSHRYADGRIHDVDILRDVNRMKKWLERARKALA